MLLRFKILFFSFLLLFSFRASLAQNISAQEAVSLIKAVEKAQTNGLSNCASPVKWDRTYSEKYDIKQPMKADRILLVTHATTRWDRFGVIEQGVNFTVEKAIQAGLPIIYLVHPFDKNRLNTYYLSYEPNFLHFSEDGSHRIEADANEVQLAGGYFGNCLSYTMGDAIRHCAPNRNKLLRITLHTDSIYVESENKDSVMRLNDRISSYSDDQLSSFFYHRGLTGTGLFEKSGRIEKYTLKLMREGRPIRTFGSGERLIEVNFLGRSKSP